MYSIESKLADLVYSNPIKGNRYIVNDLYAHVIDTYSNEFGTQAACFKILEKVFIVFAGSNGLNDWKYNFWATTKSGVHEGYYRLFNVPSLLEWTLRISVSYYDRRITFIGHSAGGALVKLYAEYFRGQKRMNFVTFGAPKVFKKKIVLENITCYTNALDPVTKVPFRFKGLKQTRWKILGLHKMKWYDQ